MTTCENPFDQVNFGPDQFRHANALSEKELRIQLTGDPPSPIDPPPGCRFAPRCPVAVAACRQAMPELREMAPGQWVRCHRVEAVGGTLQRPLEG